MECVLTDAHSHAFQKASGFAARNVSLCFPKEWRNISVTKGGFGGGTERGKTTSLGLHPRALDSIRTPLSAAELADELEGAFQTALVRPPATGRPAAVGECGLDRFSSAPVGIQKEVFVRQVLFAKAQKKPLVVHCVGLWGLLADCLEEFFPSPEAGAEGGVKFSGLVHAACCSREIAERLLRLGFCFSFGARELGRKKGVLCAECIPVNRILAESDAEKTLPEADYAAIITRNIEKIAEIKNFGAIQMSDIIYGNFKTLFGE